MNRKFIIHKTFLERIESSANSCLQMKLNNFNEQEIVVSRRTYKRFEKLVEVVVNYVCNSIFRAFCKERITNLY